MSVFLALLSCFVLGVVTFVALKLLGRSAHFHQQGIPYLGLGLGRTLRLLTGRLTMADMEQEVHRDALSTGAPLVGITDMSGHLGYYITDLDLVKQVVVKDFDHFVNRRQIQGPGSKGWFRKLLFFMEGDQWKLFRAKMSPTFTSAKIRRMFNLFQESSEKLEKYVVEQMESGKNAVNLDFTQLFSKYSMDVIAACAFGLDSGCWTVPLGQLSTFEKMGHKFGFDFTGKTMFKFLLMMASPSLADRLGVDMLDREAAQYFAELIREMIRRRRQQPETRREDFLQMMLDAQEGLLKADEEAGDVMMGQVEGDVKVPRMVDTPQGKISFEDDEIVANGMIFLMAGFGPTQAVLLAVVHTLATRPEIQEKLYEQVSSVLEKHGGKLSYEALSEMVYLEMVTNETVRNMTLASRAERVCTKDYQIPGTNKVIKKGSLVVVPISGFHKDPRFYPHPDKYDPERFSPENKASRPALAFLPFGYGPRNCLGMRFSLIKTRAVIAHLVHCFKFSPCEKTQLHLDFGNSFVKPKGGLWVQVSRR